MLIELLEEGELVMMDIVFSFFILLIISIVAFIVAVAVLWRKGKTVEAMMVWMSLWLYLITLILFFRL